MRASVEESLFFQVIVVVVAVAFAVAFAVVALLLWRRRRVFATGLRGTGLVIRVEPTGVMNRYSLAEAPTEMVTVATSAVPGGAAPQKMPAGHYVVGQEVAVVQPPGRPYAVRLDRPDLEPPRWRVLGVAAMALAAPLIAVRFLLDAG